MNVTCQYCGNHWYLTPEAIHYAVENSPKKGRSIGVECPRCRKLVKIARPRQLPPLLSGDESESESEGGEDASAGS